MSLRKRLIKRATARRVTALTLALVMLCGLMPAAAAPADTAEQPRETSWVEGYLEKLVSWGVMRGDLDGNLHPERDITRAEFVTMVNRAFGYDEMGENPFKDVPDGAWYANDIRIANNMGYFSGTSETTAEPDRSLTREEAAVLLGRNMMLQAGVSEVLEFSDGRELQEWSRGLVQAAARSGVISGYPDGSFKPNKKITRGEVASMLVRLVGTPIQASGSHELGSVYGNVTINTSGVTLKNTVIAGDLYLTGGIGLGDIVLENVTVLGKIVASGGGESSKGDNSIVLRNVTANEMVVDSLADQFVTIRAEGNTDVNTTNVRTDSYIEDMTKAGKGLKYVELNGEPGTSLQMAGNIKEVVNVTPGSRLVFAKGVVEKVTIDEKAIGSTVTIENGANVKDMNLDVGINVSGKGDIGHITINAPGSNVSMLPDTIDIRPGIIGNVGGESMDTAAAAESSMDPKLLAGYPRAQNVAPTNAEVVFSTNKKGTVYWAISALADGSVDEEELISPPAYAGKILKSGTTAVGSSKTDVAAKISGLTSGGSYYISAILVDARDQRSPLKVAAFTTPDDTKPDFASGYPFMSQVTNKDAQVTVMPTKSCQMYYALMPKGATAPKPADFKTGALEGNLGYGSTDVVKNSTTVLGVNRMDLEELESYVLYLWLTDYDGAKSSAVKPLPFATVDKTPPVFLRDMDVTDVKANGVELTYALNEPGSVFWVVVKEGEDYPKPMGGQPGKPDLTDDAAKIQVESGMNALKKGSSKAGKAQSDTKVQVSGLEPQTAYDLYYVAKDTAGNYSVAVKVRTINTLDDQAPTVRQEFTRYNGTETDVPLADTDIRLIFAESVQGVENAQGEKVYTPWMDLYQKVQKATGDAKETYKKELANELRKHIILYSVNNVGQTEVVPERTGDSGKTDPWVIDYRNVAITMEDGQMVLTFLSDPKDPNAATSALNLSSGSTYYFEITGIADTSTAANLMGNTSLPEFTTIFAQVILSVGDVVALGKTELENETDDNLEVGDAGEEEVRIDMSFKMDPVGTGKVDPSVYWDALLWSDTTMKYTLYSKGEGEDKWTNEGSNIALSQDSPDGWAYSSLKGDFPIPANRNPDFTSLNVMEPRTYAVHVESIEENPDYTAWNKKVQLRVSVVAGSRTGLLALAGGDYTSDWESAKETHNLASIGIKDPFTLVKPFKDNMPPVLIEKTPSFKVGDIQTEINVMLDRPGTVYCVAVPLRDLQYQDPSNPSIEEIISYSCDVLPYDKNNNMPLPKNVPNSGADLVSDDPMDPVELSTPSVTSIISGKYQSNSNVRTGKAVVSAAGLAYPILLKDLEPDTIYYVYLATKGVSAVQSDYALCYKFKTEESVRPVITLDLDNPNVNVSVDKTSYLSYMLVSDNGKIFNLYEQFSKVVSDTSKMSATEKANYIDADYQVLDALIDDYKKDGQIIGSVFDQFADQTEKDKLLSNIENRTPDNTNITMKVVSEEWPQNVIKSVDCTPGLYGSGYYIFLAAGKSQLGSGYSFRAIRPVQRRDDAPPKIDSISTINLGSPSNDPTGQNQPFNGTLTVHFDKELYYRVQAGQKQYIIPIELTGKKDPFPPETDGKPDWSLAESYPLGNLIQPGFIGSVKVMESPGMKTDTITLAFYGFQNGRSINILKGICDAGGAGGTDALTLTMKVVKDEAGYWQPEFEVTPTSWLKEEAAE